MNVNGPPRDPRREMNERMGQSQESPATVIRETGSHIAPPPGVEAVPAWLDEPLPDGGGAAETPGRLFELGVSAGGHTAGPKCFHFVVGGGTPPARLMEFHASIAV